MTQEQKEDVIEYKKGLKIYKPEKWLNWDEHYYLRNWKKDSDHFLEKGYYKWMTEMLGEHVEPKTLLDTGCGNGNAIIQLLKSFPSLEHLITIEVNSKCIEETKNNLKKFGCEVEVIKRKHTKCEDKKMGLFRNVFDDIDDLKLTSRITIIEGDMHNDDKLYGFLSKNLKVDAITCWLIGTNHSVQRNIDFISKYKCSDSNYRFLVQNKVYEIADLVLNSDGILQIVDRFPCAAIGEVETQIRKSHEDQASVTKLKVRDISSILYEIPKDGIAMIQTGCDATVENPDPHFVSVIASR